MNLGRLDRGISRRRALLGGLVAAAAMGTLACTPTTQVTVASPQQQTGISVTGTGRVSVRPDIARLSLGVEVTDATVSAARSRAADAATAVQAALGEHGVEDRDIRTLSVNISPQYDYGPERSGPPRITGYVVSNQVEVTVRDIDATSEVMDAAIAAGGDAARLNGVTFTVDDPEEFLVQAREDAVEQARARAEVLARAAGVTLGPALSITEFTNGGTPMFDMRQSVPAPANTGGAPTPVNPGEQELQLTVTVVYDLAGEE